MFREGDILNKGVTLSFFEPQNMLTVGFVYNLKVKNPALPDTYLEWDDQSTIEAVEKALGESCNVISIELDSSLWENLNRYKEKIDILFNIAEGLKGPWREAIVPIFAEELGIPYTGSNPSTMVLCLDKGRTKEVLSCHNIKYPSFKVFNEIPELSNKDISPLEFPLIVKPLWEGSSKGIRNSSLVLGACECQNEIARIIREYEQPALVEEFIPGREFTVGILGNGEDIMVLPIVELNLTSLPPGSSPIYSYEAKWIWDVPDKLLDIFSCPARISTWLERRVVDAAIGAFKALGCRDWCRIDIRLDKEENPYILELNPIPGILPDPRSNSCFPKAVYTLGWDYSRLITTVLEIACKRYRIEFLPRRHEVTKNT